MYKLPSEVFTFLSFIGEVEVNGETWAIVQDEHDTYAVDVDDWDDDIPMTLDYAEWIQISTTASSAGLCRKIARAAGLAGLNQMPQGGYVEVSYDR